MTKTKEQSEADEALETSIKQVVEAYGLSERLDATLMEFVCVVETGIWDEDGDILTDILMCFRGGTMKLSTCIGILTQGLDQMRSRSRPLVEGEES